MRSRVVGAAVLLSVCCATAATAQRRDFLLFTDPGGQYSIEFPKDWRWMRVAPSGEPIAVFAQPKNEAGVVLERFEMLAPPELTDAFAQVEADYVKDRQPGAADMLATLGTVDDKPVIILDYTRPGVYEKERVRQYSFLIGQNLYRVTCMSLESQFTKYEKLLLDVAKSLKDIRK